MHDISTTSQKKSRFETFPIRLSEDQRKRFELLARSRAERLGLKGRSATLTAFFFHHIELLIAYSTLLEGADLHHSDVALLLKDPLFQGLVRNLFSQPQPIPKNDNQG